MSSDVIWHIRDKLWPMPKHGSIRKVYACLAVTCHLHFWQNDRDFLRATVVTRGWNGYRNQSQHRKSTLEKKILPPFQQGFEPATFQSRVRCSNHWAIPAPIHTAPELCLNIRLRLMDRIRHLRDSCRMFCGTGRYTGITEVPYPIHEELTSRRDRHTWWPHAVLNLVLFKMTAVVATRGTKLGSFQNDRMLTEAADATSRVNNITLDLF